MRGQAISVGIGLVSGVLSGAFGIGGGIITTPAIRLLLGAPALIAVGTPLPVIFPAAFTGALTYAREGVADLRTGLICGLAGTATAVLGAWATTWAGGETVLVVTAALVLYTAADVTWQALRSPRAAPTTAEKPADSDRPPRSATFADPPADGVSRASASAVPLVPLMVIGAMTGLYSGFLGLGGGFVLVPLLTRWLGFDVKRAIATSLVAVTVLAVPGTIAHAFLGNIDWGIAFALMLGVVPGAVLGARLTLRAGDRTVRLGFAALLLLVGVWLVASELPGLLR